MCVYPRIDSLPVPLLFLSGCRRRRLQATAFAALYFSVSVIDSACFVLFFGFCVHVLFSSLTFRYQYRCNLSPGRFVSPCVEWDVKPRVRRRSRRTFSTHWDFSTTFRRRRNLFFFDSDFKFFDDASEFSVASLYVIFPLQSSCQFFFKPCFYRNYGLYS